MCLYVVLCVSYAMLAIERKNKIIQIIKTEKIAKVDALANKFSVSEMTIRRDLEEFEKEGLIRRCHGGAVLSDGIMHEVPYADKNASDPSGKEEIAAYALRLIKPGSAIFLDAGTTIMRLAKRLLDLPDLTVVTNDLSIASVMSNSASNIIMLGGSVANSLGSVHGPTAERMLRELRLETAMVGGQSINENFDLFATTEAKACLRRLLMEQANQTYLLVDKTKFYRQALFRVHNICEYAGVITDKDIIDTEQRYFDDNGINMISVAGKDNG